jgi:general secretion pathway protein H
MRARQRSAPRRQGFTLLEVLMVVLLVGILGSVVMLSIDTGGPGRYLREEADRLSTLIEQAANEAVMQNQEYGLRLEEGGYRFLCLDEARQEWADCKDEIFRARTLAEGLELRLLKQGSIRELPLDKKEGDDAAERQRQDEEGKRITPDLFLLSSGESSAARLEIRVPENPELNIEIDVDPLGRVTRSDDADTGAKTAEAGNDR